MRIVLVLFVVLVLSAPARAATWSPPRAFDRAICSPPQACVFEPAPRVAVNARGQAVAAWVDSHGRVRVAVAKRPGHFGAARTLARRGLRPSPTIARDGTVTVVFEQGEALRFARGTARSRELVPHSRREDGSAYAAAQADGSVVVVYESRAEMRTVTISAAGEPSAPVTLGKGGFGHDSARAASDGTLAACCITPVNTDPSVPPDTAPKVAVYRGGWRLVPVPGLRDRVDIEIVFANATALILGLVDVHTSGDAGVSGIPGSALAGTDDVFAAPAWASVSKPTRGLAPDVTLDGAGRTVLVYQQKTGPRAFSRDAPVYASVAGGRGRRLTSRPAYQPTVRPLGKGALAIWQEPGDRWGVAIERAGRFTSTPAPRGPGPKRHLGEDFHYAYGLATNGTHAVLTWVAADGSIRVSELAS